MIKVLALKELREIAWLAALALVAYAALVGGLMGYAVFSMLPWYPQGSNEIPFISPTFEFSFTMISGALAIALGFCQSAWESVRGTYVFLLHRPVPRPTIFLAKLGVGVILFLVCAAAPIFVYGWWCATPRNHPSPFLWSMTDQSWRYWLSLPTVYLGAFLSGLRPARWLGTRLLPLVGSLPLALLLGESSMNWTTLALTVGIVDTLFVVAIVHAAKSRDYP
jgi:hypothetical protein